MGFNPIYRAYYPGIQARILVDNYYCMAESPALTPGVHVKAMRQLAACARFLERGEPRYRKGNQQVAAVLGLGIVGLVFPEFKDAPKWVERAETIMAEHLEKDFFGDGGHRELCTQYHKTCLRDTCYVALTSEHNGRPSPLLRGANGEALERSFDWLARLIMPTGETPPLHSAVFSTDHAVYSLVSAIHFKRPDHAYLASRFWSRGAVPNQKSPMAFRGLLCSVRRWRLGRCRLRDRRSICGTHLEESGFAVMRSGWEADDRYLVFQYGWANTGHAYPVALSFLLEMNGEVVATHAGSPRSYRHPAYGYCHSTMSHQTVSIDGKSYPRADGAAPGGRLEWLADLPGLWYVSAYHLKATKRRWGRFIIGRLWQSKTGRSSSSINIERRRGAHGRLEFSHTVGRGGGGGWFGDAPGEADLSTRAGPSRRGDGHQDEATLGRCLAARLPAGRLCGGGDWVVV